MTLRVAAVQLVSGGDVAANLAAAERGIAAAAAQGAELVALPEYFAVLGGRAALFAHAEDDGTGPLQAFLSAAAQRHGVWLVGGTIPLRGPEPDRVRNACLVHAPDGTRAARYDKIHLFALNGTERHDESRDFGAGDRVVAFDVTRDGAPPVRVGLSVCYDLRFPELYRALAPCDLLLVPSAFTAETGAAHWHVLLRARAIENQCYVLAPAQGGVHANGTTTYGHSLLVDPWGEVVAECGMGEDVIVGAVDPGRIGAVRGRVPALGHRRGDLAG